MLSAPKMRLMSLEEFNDSTVEVEDLASVYGLKTLYLDNCTSMMDADIEALIMPSRNGDSWDSFEKLILRGCRLVTDAFLVDLKERLDGKLEWYDCGD